MGREGGGVGGGYVLAGGLLFDLAGGCGGAGAAAVASPALWLLVEKMPPRKQMLGSWPPPPVADTVDSLREGGREAREEPGTEPLTRSSAQHWSTQGTIDSSNESYRVNISDS